MKVGGKKDDLVEDGEGLDTSEQEQALDRAMESSGDSRKGGLGALNEAPSSGDSRRR